jgi:hypothetical protein
MANEMVKVQDYRGMESVPRQATIGDNDGISLNQNVFHPA